LLNVPGDEIHSFFGRETGVLGCPAGFKGQVVEVRIACPVLAVGSGDQVVRV
jgi:hypothetical protein